MILVSEYGNDDIAKVYVARMRETDPSKKYLVEFVESVQPPLPREKKWVIIVSSMFGCPIGCRMCDAGGDFLGRLSADEILQQVDHIVRRRFPDAVVPVQKFKIQFARMGEPSLNPAVLEAMERLPETVSAPGLNVSMSTVAPGNAQTHKFFEQLLSLKDRLYPGGRFQLQFSIHTTDMALRDELIPANKWSFEKIAEYGARFAHPETGDKKVTLNFAPAKGFPIDARAVRAEFDPDRFMIKLTPLNPTVRSSMAALESAIRPDDLSSSRRLVNDFEEQGFDVVLSIGELEENKIGSNCGQFIQRALGADNRPEQSYELERYGLGTRST
jgi:23S rRNA (adenine2503-C2)-methyltransferase